MVNILASVSTLLKYNPDTIKHRLQASSASFLAHKYI